MQRLLTSGQESDKIRCSDYAALVDSAYLSKPPGPAVNRIDPGRIVE